MKSPSGVAILGAGHRIGDKPQENEELCRGLDITPEWIIEKTGIRRRYLASPGQTASEYAVTAATDAMNNARISAAEIDMIVCCTYSADYIFPPLSAKIHNELGVRGGQIFDLQVNCGGFVSGLTLAAERMICDPDIRHAIVIGVEFNSRFINPADANTSIYHSDGAGAVVLGRVPGFGLLSSAFHTDSSNYESVRLRGGGSSFPIMNRSFNPDTDVMELNGIATWKQAITHLPPTIRAACAKAGITPSEIDFFVFHQANYNLIDYLMKKMRREMDSTYTNVQRIGNTGAASVPIALSEAMKQNLLLDNAMVAFAAVGAGFNFGASVWKWGQVQERVA